MKRKMQIRMPAAILTICGLVGLSGCSHDMDDYTPKKPYTITDAERVSYAENKLGIRINPKQDWTLTKVYSVKVTANAPLKNINQVVILDANPFAATAHRLALTEIANNDVANLTFRAVETAEVLYAACMTKDGLCMARPFTPGTDTEVSFTDQRPAATRSVTRAVTSADAQVESFYIKDFYNFRRTVMTKLPEGQDNRQFIGDHNYTNTVQVRKDPYAFYDLPLVYLGGSGSDTDNMAYICYKGGLTANADTFLIKDNFSSNGTIATKDDVTKRYRLSGYYLTNHDTDGRLNKQFVAGDIVTFKMADGETLMTDTPNERVKVFLLNGYVFVACEDGDDWDYNDRLFWIPYGYDFLEDIQNAPFDPEPVEPEVWTYAWEDKDFGDYDMNDCVIEVQENAQDATKLDVKLLALGAKRNLWLGFENKNAKDYRDYQPVFQKELHEVLGVKPGTLVNTGLAKANPVTVTVSKPAGFDFQTCSFVLGVKTSEDQQGVYLSDYYYISIPTAGQDPHAIAIPGKWQWPTETTPITAAYPDFATWAQDISNTAAKGWYNNPVQGKVMSK